MTTLKQKIRRRYAQRGKSNTSVDSKRPAKRVGWRKSKSGKVYFDNRTNRSDRNKKKRL